jgi:type VI secretion system Hcp family effector
MVSGLTKVLTLSTCLAVLAIVAVAPSSSEALEAYLNVVGNTQGAIHGDSKVKQAQGAIVVQAIGLGLTVDIANTAGGGTAVGRAEVAPLKIAKLPDQASPKLMLAALTGEVLKVDLTWFGADLPGGPVSKTFSITLEGAMISEIDTSGATTVLIGVSEQVSFKFNKITYRDERLNPAVVTCWDLTLNRRC